jgi:hypothetical protein
MLILAMVCVLVIRDRMTVAEQAAGGEPSMVYERMNASVR